MSKYVSIVIPCKDDYEIVNSIASIDYAHTEVVTVFNGSTEEFIAEVTAQMDITRFKKFSVIKIKEPNLALALQTGTDSAVYDLVLYMDSDCLFDMGAIRSFVDVANKNDLSTNVFKGDVIFEEGQGRIGKMIARSREHHTAEVLTAYKPPLMISKQILPKIGGYAFNVKLIWREDSDLDNRIREAGIDIIHVPIGRIFHHTISLKTDLRSTFRYGIGLAIADKLHIKLTEVPRSTMSAFRSKGLIVASYMLFRNRIYDAGYAYASIRMVFGKYIND